MSSAHRPTVVFVEANITGNGPRLAEAARRLGLDTVMITNDPDQYPWLASLGTTAVTADTSRATTVAAACESLRAHAGIAAVTTTADVYASIAAEAADLAGLPGPSAQAARCCRDKASQRALLVRAGLPQPRHHQVRDPDDAVRWSRAAGLPVVVKPVDGTASIAVRWCAGTDDVVRAVGDVLSWRVNHRGLPTAGRALVEEVLTGPEYSVESLDDSILAITAKTLGELPSFVELGHDVPARLPAADRAAIESATLVALKALGLTRGPAHTEVRLTPRGPVIVEVNPRMAGDHIPALVELATGVDYYAAVIRSLLDLPDPTVGQPVIAGRAASVRFVTAPGDGGVLRRVDGVAEARTMPGVHEAHATAKAGAPLRHHGDYRDRLAYVIATGADPEQSAARARAACDRITPVLA